MNSRVLKVIAILTLSLFSLSSFAKIMSTCELSGQIELNSKTVISCDRGTLSVANGTKIVTNGYDLELGNGVANIEFSNLEIRAFNSEHSPKSENAGTITVRALTCVGAVKVFNDGLGEEGMSGDVTFECDYKADGFKTSVVLDAAEATYSDKG